MNKNRYKRVGRAGSNAKPTLNIELVPLKQSPSGDDTAIAVSSARTA